MNQAILTLICIVLGILAGVAACWLDRLAWLAANP